MKRSTSFTRARQPEQIEQRRREILKAAAFLMKKNGFDNVSLNAIAERTGLAKSNIYRYFESKEDIYLHLLKVDWARWLEQVENDLQPHRGSNDIEVAAKVFTQAYCASPRLCELISVMASVLENNLSEEALIGFKTDSGVIFTRVLALISMVLPNIPSDKVPSVAHSALAIIAGLWPLCHPSAKLKKVLQRPEFELSKLDFSSSLETAITLLFKGACSK